MMTSKFTNIFPIELQFDEFTIQRVDYNDELLKELRAKYNATHSFFRNEQHIYISNKSGNDLGIGQPYKFNVYSEHEITASLMRHVFFKTFLEKYPGRTPLDFYPFRLLSTRDIDDWVYTLLPENLKNKLGYKKVVELQIRYLEVNGKKTFTCVINIERRWVLNLNCKEILALNFNSEGYEVLHSELIPGLKGVLAPNEEFIGKIQKIHADTAQVETAHGIKDIKLEELFLRKTNFNIKSFLVQTNGEAFAEKSI